MIDLRSDTITKPTDSMRAAMAKAEVGDDVLGDDPTVNELESAVAELLGKEAAVFMPSGTMSNQIAVRAHTEPGDEIILDANAHIYYYEAGAPAALSGVMCRLIDAPRGIFSTEDVRKVLRPQNLHFPRTKLVCIENTHNRGGGAIWPLEQIKAVSKLARENGLKMHLDGARIWNASVATGIPEREYAASFDSLSVCFSKGLGAPVGSALAGTREFIARARRFRKQFGGGMRQAGIIAAGALYALRHHRSRLAEDHSNAKKLALGLAAFPEISMNASELETNIVNFSLKKTPADNFAKELEKEGVLMLARGPLEVRAVTSLCVNSKDMDAVIAAIGKVLKKM